MTACAIRRPPANRSGIDVPQEALLETIGLLSSAGALVIRWSEKQNRPG